MLNREEVRENEEGTFFKSRISNGGGGIQRSFNPAATFRRLRSGGAASIASGELRRQQVPLVAVLQLEGFQGEHGLNHRRPLLRADLRHSVQRRHSIHRAPALQPEAPGRRREPEAGARRRRRGGGGRDSCSDLRGGDAAGRGGDGVHNLPLGFRRGRENQSSG